ncbi:helix-turn-helix domain-containing protein [Brevundimonas sp. PAMC22021]|uniref:helix-turn-helix domain-containing protein n=1 Tax=Brevundimonas sp. PAMC22021 TaxID=2861285 RepID=UPI001C633D0B|nr:helix-turn-helix domain-containing protein [Brevundimonas sp. PAMC22021]QYF86059.1 helix-turn-helix domain-containing protein [Brevundimonas sp. PAMC22021]
MTRLDYRYDECGLDNVILVGLEACQDDDGHDIITIRHINVLHRAIVEAIGAKPSALTGRELRFLRTELGLTQAELALSINKDAQTVARWEKGKGPIDPTADTVIRILALQHSAEEIPPIHELARWAVASSAEAPIRIDARDQDNWQPLAA